MQRRDFLKTSALAGSALLFSRKLPAADASDQAVIEIMLDEPVGTISPLIYSHFTEELGAVIYDGVWVGEKSKIPNTGGIRTALIEKMRQIKAPAVRWPGGCFADSYDWRDGVGPKDKRPRRTDFWVDDPDSKNLPKKGPPSFDPNQFGTDEFVRFCKLCGAEPYLAANVRSLNAYTFDQWIEYCNSPAGSTTWSEVRAADGSAEPYNVQYWGVGVPVSPAPVTVATYTLPPDIDFQVQAGFPAAAPDSFGTGTNAIDFDQGMGLGSQNYIMFMPDGSSQDTLGNYNSGVLYMNRTGDLYSSRAVSVFGTTGRVRGWRLYNQSGNTWVQQ